MRLDRSGHPEFSDEAPPIDVLDTPAAGPRAIRGSAVRAGGYVAGALLALAAAPLLVRHLGIAEFGQYVTVISLIALIQGVTDAGLGAVMLREYSARSGEDRDGFMRSILGARLLTTASGVVVATGFTAVAGYGGDVVLGTFLAGIGLVLTMLTATYAVPLAASLRVGWLTAIELGGRAAAVVLIVGLVLASAGLVPFLAVTVPAGLLTVAVTVAVTRGAVPLRPSFALSDLKPLVRETLPLALAVILGTLYARIVIIIMSLITTELVTGYFGTALRVIDVAVGVPVAIVGTTFPILARAARDDHERLRYVLQRVLEVALIGGVWMSLVTALTARLVADIIVGGPEAANVADILRIFALALVLVFLNVTWQTTLLALRRHRDLLRVNAMALVVIVTLTFVLVPLLGARGAVLAVIGGEAFLMTLSAAALIRSHPDLRPSFSPLVPVVVASVSAAAVAVAADRALGAGNAPGAVLATVVYFGVLGGLSAIPTELRGAFTELRRGAHRGL